jgi:hypothetical protein
MAEQQQALQALTEEYQKLEQGQSACCVYVSICSLTLRYRVAAECPVTAEARITATGEQAGSEGRNGKSIQSHLS